MRPEVKAWAWALLAAVATAGAATGAPPGEEFAFAALGEEIHVGFALVRTPAAGPARSTGDVVSPGSDSIARILYDPDGGTYFGYRLAVSLLPTGDRFRVEFSPLTGDEAAAAWAVLDCPDCPAPELLRSPSQRFPGPRLVSPDELVSLELLVNPSTGEKIVDIIRFSTTPIRVEDMVDSSKRMREALEAVSRADSLVTRGSYQEAIPEYERALAITPNDAVVHNRVGVCYQRAGHPNRARRHYEIAVEIDPAYASVWNNLGSIEHGRGRYLQAIEMYEKAILIRPDSASTYRNLGAAYFALHRVDEGVQAYRAALRLDPTVMETPGNVGVQRSGVDSAARNYHLARICAANGQVDASLDFLEKASADGFRDFRDVERDPTFRDVVADPRFRALVRGE